MFSAIIGFRLCFLSLPKHPENNRPLGNHGDIGENPKNHETRHRYQFCTAYGKSSTFSG